VHLVADGAREVEHARLGGAVLLGEGVEGVDADDVDLAEDAEMLRDAAPRLTDDADAAPGTVETVRLNGFGYQPVAGLSAATLTPSANVGNAAGPQTVVATNTGDGLLSIRAI